MGIVKLVPEFVVKDVPLVVYLRKELKDPDLIMFQSSRNGNWTLAHWVDKFNGIINCIELLGQNYHEKVTRSFIDALRRNRNPEKVGEMKKNILKYHNKMEDAEDESLMETNDHWKWLKKKTAQHSPVPYSFTSKITRK